MHTLGIVGAKFSIKLKINLIYTLLAKHWSGICPLCLTAFYAPGCIHNTRDWDRLLLGIFYTLGMRREVLYFHCKHLIIVFITAKFGGAVSPGNFTYSDELLADSECIDNISFCLLDDRAWVCIAIASGVMSAFFLLWCLLFTAILVAATESCCFRRKEGGKLEFSISLKGAVLLLINGTNRAIVYFDSS